MTDEAPPNRDTFTNYGGDDILEELLGSTEGRALVLATTLRLARQYVDYCAERKMPCLRARDWALRLEGFQRFMEADHPLEMDVGVLIHLDHIVAMFNELAKEEDEDAGSV